MRKSQKILICLALLMIAVTAIASKTDLNSFAWFSSNRQLRTTAEVITAALDIRGADGFTAVTRVELETLDDYTQQFQFTVRHSDSPYCIALANTRNVSSNDVTFSIYAVNGNVRTPVDLTLLNPSTDTHDSYYSATFADGDTVQKDAIPLYRISGQIDVESADSDSYVLEVNWEHGIDHFDTSKETDMLYLFAQMILN